MATSLNTTFMKLIRRAETNDPSTLVDTFVDIGPLVTLLSNRDHQVLYGRRGTGKTHVLLFLAESRRKQGDCVVYLDMRVIGSTGGLYADASVSLSQRATRLLGDTLRAIHESLYEFFVERAEELNLSYTGPLLDQLADAITDVAVVGTVERENKASGSSKDERESSWSTSASTDGVELGYEASDKSQVKLQVERREVQTGVPENRIHIGAVGTVFRDMSQAMQQKRVWILLDEWSSLPVELQPYLADLLKRAVLAVPGFTVKIAAIEQRARFRIPRREGDHIGIELGSDISADLDLDDFMVFDNDSAQAKQFFKDLLYKHISAIDGLDTSFPIRSSDEMIRQGFTQSTAFDEYVRASEGVPRDAINIIILAAQKALNDRISMSHIRTAARNWYQRDKESALKEHYQAHELLHWITDTVIGQRKARAFLFRNDVSDEFIDFLFDSRVLHVLKKNISTRDQPGIRYDAYKLDYGCYVHLINTVNAPHNLLPEMSDSSFQDTFKDSEEDGVLVPPDDYRAIRRAILDISSFKQRGGQGLQTDEM